jgi:hypothetical protein
MKQILLMIAVVAVAEVQNRAQRQEAIIPLG